MGNDDFVTSLLALQKKNFLYSFWKNDLCCYYCMLNEIQEDISAVTLRYTALFCRFFSNAYFSSQPAVTDNHPKHFTLFHKGG